MERTYEFYKNRYNYTKDRVDELKKILSDLENCIIDEDAIRNNDKDLLKMCVCEYRIDLLKKLISPFEFKTGEVYKNPLTLQECEKVRYHYLIDFYTIKDCLDEFPSSIMEAWYLVKRDNKLAEFFGDEKKDESLESVSKDIVLLTRAQREDILRTANTFDYKKVSTMRMKDVLARCISGMCHPIYSEDDVKMYCELPVLSAGLELYGKNIRTLANDTGGCFNDNSLDGKLYETNLYIDYDSLDEYNKFYFNLLVAKGFAKFTDGRSLNACIYVMNTPEEDVSRVIAEFDQIVAGFHKQDVLYGTISPDKLWANTWNNAVELNRVSECEIYLETGITNEELVSLANSMGIESYYSSDNDVIYKHPSYLEKHKEYVGSINLSK